MTKEKLSKFVVLVIVLLFFISTSWLVFGMNGLVNSPDEAANYQFALSFAEDGDLRIHEPINAILGGIVHPRSMASAGEFLLPRSFSGLPMVYGFLSRIVGNNLVFYLTPLLAILMLFAFREVVVNIFKDKLLANVSALMVLLHPGFWFYSARTFMHNVPFVAFLTFSVYFFVVRPVKKVEWINFALAGAMVGSALAFRTSEIIWIVASCSLLLPLVIVKRVKFQSVFLFAFAAILVLIPVGLMNADTYGSFFETGYTFEASVIEAVSSYEGVIDAPQIVQQNKFSGALGYLFPFGIHELAILRHVWGYGFLLYPWMTGLAILGLFALLRNWKEESNSWKYLTIYTLVLAAWLGVVYGSWTFHDNPDPNVVTLGNSYVRYWLPLFVLAAPFAARSVINISRLFMPHARKFVIGGVTLSVAILSANLVFFGPDGFVHTRAALQSFEEKRELIVASTEDDAIIIVDRADKFVYPSRRVVTPLRSEETFAYLELMTDQAPVYYFGITLPEEDITFLNEEQLAQMGLRAELVVTHTDESLYSIARVEPRDR